MPVQKLTIEEFLQLAKQHPVFDVRSPGEYTHAHIPNAVGLPLFTDEERKVVGTAYKQQSKQAAIKIGLDYFGVKMKSMVEEVEKITAAFTKGSNNSNAPVSPPAGGGGGGWPLWEVFIRSKQGLDHKHVGSLHATDAAMAIENARDVYTRRQEGVSIWVVESNYITASNPE